MKFSVLLHGNSINNNVNHPHLVPDFHPAGSKLERLPEYFRDTMEWFLGRSRRKAAGEGKENALGKGAGKTGSLSQSSTRPQGKSPSSDFTSVCESIDDELLRRLSTIPPGMEPNEWLATHAVAFFHHVNALYGAVSEFCTNDSCPMMSCYGFPQLLWVDEKGKKFKYSAPQYVDCVMSFCEKASCSEELFPTKYGSQFSSAFEAHVKRVVRLLWHCCGHLYSAHWEQLNMLGLRPQASLVLAHMDAFCSMAHLLEPKEGAALRQTVAIVRPPTMVEEHHPMAMRNEPVPMDTEPGRGQATAAFGNTCGPPKSGSWGGVPSPTSVDFGGCKPCAQTC